jgi:polyhydroxybutyrate depolymerase
VKDRPLLALALALALGSGGCRRSARDAQVRTLDGESEVLPLRVPTPAPPGALRVSTHTVEAAGKRRSYLLVEPTRLEPNRQYPLVLVFHGDGGTMTSFHDAFPFERASGKDAILAYPDGLGSTWDLESQMENRDVRFVEVLIDELLLTLPVARSKLFATGYSSGGFLSNVIACQRPGLLRAIASNAGGAPYKQAQTWPNGYARCPGQEPVAMLALHGEGDRGVSLDSGRFSAAYWAYVNGCSTSEMETSGYKECSVYRGCPRGKAVGFCPVPGLGHWVWERAAEASWTFFTTQ